MYLFHISCQKLAKSDEIWQDITKIKRVTFFETQLHSRLRSCVQTSGEVADTTEAYNGSAALPASAAVATETSEREAVSVAQVEAASAAEPSVRVRRDTEPVTTSLSTTEEHSRASDNAQVIA